MRKLILAVAALAGIAAFAAPTAASAAASPATVKAVVHASQHPDTSNVCNTGAIGPDCVWGYDNMSRQMVVTPTGSGTYTVNITDQGSFTGFADPVTGAPLASNGPVKGTYQLTVTSANSPNPANLPSQMNGDVSTSAMIKALFGNDPNIQITGGPYTYSYQNGNYVQDTNCVTGDVTGH
jgi:hypothetical protein